MRYSCRGGLGRKRCGDKGGKPAESWPGVPEKCEPGVREAPGKKVAVIGGGNVAIDVARTLLRMGANRW